MRKVGNNVGDIEQLRREREARMNPPEYEIGQDEEDGWDFFNEPENNGGGFNDGGAFMDDSSFSGVGGNSFEGLNGLGGGMPGGVQQQTPSNTSTEDKFFEGVAVVGKYTFKSSKNLFDGINEALKGNNAFYWTTYGKKVMVIGVWVSVGGLILSVLGLFTVLSEGFWVLIGGLLTLAIGLLIFCLNCEKAKDFIPSEEPSLEDTPSFEEESWSNSFVEEEDYEEGNSWNSFNEEEDYEEEDNYDPWASLNNIDATVEEDNQNSIVEENIEDAIDGIREIPPHTQTRQYLFEEYSRVLPLVNPSFANLKPISENSDDFIIFDKILRDASLQVGTHEEKLPDLLELRENQFIIQIKATRPSGLKEENIANEIANIYSRDDYGSVVHEGVYATTSSVGSSFIINIFKGENSLVTLADTYKEVKDFILDPSIKKPIVMGVNELGKVWTFDAEKIFSYIISGKPRSGKSWGVVSLVLQLCMYSSPKEVNFEVFDVKGTSSDYYNMKDYLPHFKKFESSGRLILQRLKYLTTVEADRRKKILKDNNVIAIADLKNKGNDVDMPYLYVLIDEIVGLIGTFTKEEHAEFKDLVNVLITQMPNLGIRLILIPHRVTNDIVPKTTYTNVGCIACVRSDFKEIGNTLDITKSDFPYDLSNTGDMALKTGEVNKGKTVFCHGIAITPSNEKNVVMYKFIGSLWGMLEPDIKSSENININIEKSSFKGHNLSEVVSSEQDSIDDGLEDFWNDLI